MTVQDVDATPRCPGCGAPMTEVEGAWECTSCNDILTPTGPIRLPISDELSAERGSRER
ncbi:hypothetical protein P0L94_13630 [Microbacter sp. GSS18]|nr:hypothetical protein P0L94_13630 [Microbacter sp. GSS18]